jgi:hypothetical protein
VIVVGILEADSDTSGSVIEIARAASGGPGSGPASGAAADPPRVEVLGRIPGDARWDAAMFQLAQAGVGHATVVRSAGGGMEPADLDLALHYLPEIRVIVLVRPPGSLLSTALDAATWTGATLVLVGPLEAAAAKVLDDGPGEASSAPQTPIVLEPPGADPDGTFAGFVARLAVEIDAGRPAVDAWRQTVATLAADRIG